MFRGNGVARSRKRHSLLPLTVLVALTGCGGDGGSSQPEVNLAPVFTSATALTVTENATGSIYQAAATDQNGDALTYSTTGGADAARFTISATGQLSFVTPPNYDLPADAGGVNSYQVQIAVSDGKTSTPLTLVVTVANSKEGIAVRRVGTGFVDPVAISPISDVAVLVAEKNGALYLLNPQTGGKTLLVQIADVGTVGVTALAAAPTFASDGRFFVMYTNRFGGLILNQYQRNPAGPTVPSNFGPLLAITAPQYAGGGWIGFDATGVLLAATGDAGGAGDPTGSAQDDTSRLGKLLRFAVNPDPFAGASPQFFIISTVAKGFHQANGGSVFAGGILLADHGQDTAEELDLIPAGSVGGNYGWPFKEGSRIVRGTPPVGLIEPVLEYFRDSGLRRGARIVGGASGPAAIASLRNQYVFADAGGAILAIDAGQITAGTTRASSVLERRDADFAPDAGAITRPVAVSAGPGGTLFILDGSGDVFRVDGG